MKTMHTLIQEIRENLEEDKLLSALTLALTIPDICGKVAYPKLLVGARYRRWYNEYIYPYEVPSGANNEHINYALDGYLVYALRNLVLHEGSLDLESSIRKHLNLSPNQKVQFVLNDKITSYGMSWAGEAEKDTPNYIIRINVEDLCRKLCYVAESFCKDEKNVSDIFHDILRIEF
ncbi:hypothetical protein ACF3OH_11865 [Chryseomicrobium aureum]|uniref:hypothetical protein n=1 Tax=Chryseomicrobium aureum TaxID=1441723 RepID=UPI00370DAB44